MPLDGRLTPGESPGWSRTLTVLAVLAILVATLRPQSGDVPHGWSLAELLQNIILFVPLGIALALGPWRARRCIAAGAPLPELPL